MFKGIQDLRNNDETSRAGNKWLSDEDAKLCQEIKSNISYDDIALEHKRTLGGIKSRVISHIMYPKYKNENTSIDELASIYNIEKDLIEKYIQKIENPSTKQQTTNKNKENKHTICDNTYTDKITSLKLNSLENKLMILEQKLDYIISIITK